MAANGFCWGIATGAAPNWNAGGAATAGAAVWPTFEPAVKLKLGADCAENENGLWPPPSLLLLLLLLPEPNWKGVAAGWLLLTAELEPNSNIFLACGSSLEAVAVAAVAAPPNGLAPKAAGAAPKAGAGADDWPKMDVAPPELVAPTGDATPKLLEPNVGVALLLPTADAAPNPPKVVVPVVAGLPNMGLAVAGDPNTGALETDVGAGLAAPKLNAGVDDGSAAAGFDAEKLNADEAVAVPAPKIPVEAGTDAVGAPNEPNVAAGFSVAGVAAAAAVEPKLGMTLAAGWLLWPNTKLELVVPPSGVALAGSAGFAMAAAAPKLKVGATVAVEAGAVVELMLAAGVIVPDATDEGAEAAAGFEALKLKPGVIDGPVGF